MDRKERADKCPHAMKKTLFKCVVTKPDPNGNGLPAKDHVEFSYIQIVQLVQKN